jgi:two-component system chemotaxis response regulator CheB
MLKPAKTRVICVDDSATVRDLLSEMIGEQSDLEVVAVAQDPLEARQLIKAHNPDVLTLDIKMPRMDGLEFLGHLMRLRPMPVVMISSRTQPGSEATRRALALGAHDVVAKSAVGLRHGLRAERQSILSKIRQAARAPGLAAGLNLRRGSAPIQFKAPLGATAAQPYSGRELWAIGASTGGTEAIREVLEQLPANSPPVLVVQHMPAGFTRSFAERLNRTSPLAVSEAVDGEPLMQGHAYIAPGDQHLKVERRGSHYIARLDSGPEVNRHRPSVDVLFYSVAQQAGRQARAALLTGMGKDGAAGLLALREAGAFTLAQDEASSIVFGMPREAILIGAAREVAPLDQVPSRLSSRLSLPSHSGLLRNLTPSLGQRRVADLAPLYRPNPAQAGAALAARLPMRA